ncbi:DUF2905 domain-containing protein [Aurantimonas sp. HBX-1]|uniref:DUF2905 domain-containing protein n=1 Tax=Aurantimonas sp. HBX-1 TaxID=2906072 RepID=UPI001F2A305B|nr:DUF2905 domain-containing protein [Aurantimonas sp. HBX-1]UIJ71914.1 DUF2905 domain-containing protein [Aurantimonas sp. HBX-1]
MSRTLILAGLALLAAGLLWPMLPRLGLFRLPGDIVVERSGFTLFAPVTTMILASIVLSALFWLFGR